MTDTRSTTTSTASGTTTPPKKPVTAVAGEKLQSARSAAGDAASRAADAIEANPLAVLAGGLAAGVIAGALIPRTDREREALAPVGRRLAEGAVAAVAAAKTTGKEQLTASILSRDAAKEGARKVFDSALSAAKETSNKPTAPAAASTPYAPPVV